MVKSVYVFPGLDLALLRVRTDIEDVCTVLLDFRFDENMNMNFCWVWFHFE